jgi:hypothetical protein
VFSATRLGLQSTTFSWLSLFGNIMQVGDVIFRIRPRYDTPPAVSMFVLFAILAASSFVLARRIRAIEVVT